MAGRTRTTASNKIPMLVLLFLTLLGLCRFSSSHVAGPSIPGKTSSSRDLLSVRRKNIQVPECTNLGSRPDCVQNSRCRWCRSDALDDMCFSKAEAWRLPSQVFLCD
ncbi:hypothetical protein BT93_D0188 [Corymbia citriodora subsp. variegata]|nr:hypothetical protein BT93_D0188 [Corymbia citriodora subsp. variegata]